MAFACAFAYGEKSSGYTDFAAVDGPYAMLELHLRWLHTNIATFAAAAAAAAASILVSSAALCSTYCQRTCLALSINISEQDTLTTTLPVERLRRGLDSVLMRSELVQFEKVLEV